MKDNIKELAEEALRKILCDSICGDHASLAKPCEPKCPVFIEKISELLSALGCIKAPTPPAEMKLISDEKIMKNYCDTSECHDREPGCKERCRGYQNILSSRIKWANAQLAADQAVYCQKVKELEKEKDDNNKLRYILTDMHSNEDVLGMVNQAKIDTAKEIFKEIRGGLVNVPLSGGKLKFLAEENLSELEAHYLGKG